MNTETITSTLSCGYAPSPHSPATTGTAHTHDGREICCDCADTEERASLLTQRKFAAYLVNDEIQTWTGWRLAHVASRVTRDVGFGGKRVYFKAIDVHGQRWHGNSPGDGMFCRMTRSKSA